MLHHYLKILANINYLESISSPYCKISEKQLFSSVSGELSKIALALI